MKSFKYFLFFILFSSNVFSQEITLVWGDTLSKLIFQYHDRDLSNWQEILPLYLSINPQIKNPDLIYAENKLTIPSQEEVVSYLNSQNNLGFDDGGDDNSDGENGDGNQGYIDKPTSDESQRYLSSLVDHIASPWSLELQIGPYLQYKGSNVSDLEYTAQSGFDMRAKAVYHLNDKYSFGLHSGYSKKSYQLNVNETTTVMEFPLKEIYLESYMNWNNFVVSVLLGVKDRLTYDGSNSTIFIAQHFDYGVGLHYRLVKGKKWESLVGLNAILFTASTSLPNDINKKGYDIKARAVFNYNFWPNSLVGIESVYSLSQGTNNLYDISLEDFITRLSLQFNF